MAAQILVFKTQVFPAKEQARALNSNFGGARFAYNCLLNWTIEEYEKHKQDPNHPRPNISQPNLQKVWVNELRDVYAPWHKDNSCYTYRHAAASLALAYKGFFTQKDRQRPKFKKKSAAGSFSVGGVYSAVRADGRALKAPKLGWLKTNERLKQTLWLEKMGAILQEVNFSKTSDGKYYASLRYRVPNKVALAFFRSKMTRKASAFVGVDAGLKEFATVSDRTVISNPRYYAKLEKKLARAQRAVSMKKNARKRIEPRSKSEEKARLKLARVHSRVKNSRKDFTDKTARSLIEQNKTIVIEDLDIAAMKESKLGKSISDVGWGQFRSTLEYMSKSYDTQVIVADRYFPSSKTCSQCKVVKAKLSLSERIFKCESCSLEIDRDLNASLNLRDWGIEYLRKQEAVRCTDSLNDGSARDLIALESRLSKEQSIRTSSKASHGSNATQTSPILH